MFVEIPASELHTAGHVTYTTVHSGYPNCYPHVRLEKPTTDQSRRVEMAVCLRCTGPSDAQSLGGELIFRFWFLNLGANLGLLDPGHCRMLIVSQDLLSPGCTLNHKC